MKEHPEDRVLRLESEAIAAKLIDRFCSENAAEIRALIQTYACAEAEDLLAELRERFWNLALATE